MVMIKKSITVTSQQDEWLQSQIAKGVYANDSELFRDLIRDLIRERQVRERESAQREVIRKALAESEKALETKGYSGKSVKAIMEEAIGRKVVTR
jgi:antitoxin ParD1/3/4